MEFRLLGAVVLAAAAATGALTLLHRNPLRRRTIDLLGTALVAGLAAGRVWAMLAAGSNPFTHPLDLLIVRGGVDTAAASLGAIATAAWSARRDLLPTLDALAPGAVFGLAGWHAGCLIRGACLGTPTTLPWGWPATGEGPNRHPVELYAALLLIAAGFLVVLLWRRLPGTGRATIVALFTAAAVRAVTEPLRPVLGDGRLVEYLVAAALALLLGVASWTRDARHRLLKAEG